jgi:hypothetical protein
MNPLILTAPPWVSGWAATWTVYKSPYEKKRLGKENDGGYVICDIPTVEYSILLSAGIETDISFEEAFLDKYPSLSCYAYDGTLNNIFPSTLKNISFINKNITHENTGNTTNLNDMIQTYDNIFLKMDIEGWEVPWINSLTNDQLNKFSQIVIEFHCPFTESEQIMLEKINKNHILIHLHPNNCCDVRWHAGLVIANGIECTYIHKKYYTGDHILNTDFIPNDFIDMDNDSKKPRIYLNYPPFVDLNAISKSLKS